MKRFSLFITVVLSIFFSLEAVSAEEKESVATQVSALINKYQQENKLVGLGIRVEKNEKLVATAVSGLRVYGKEFKLTNNDRWHLGSITKPITATLIARLVEQYKLSWSTTISEVFKNEKDIHPKWKAVTVTQLLSHTSGAKANFPMSVQFKRPKEGKERVQARREVVLNFLAKEPDYQAGEKFQYSNAGYTIAGAMVEQLTNTSWESIMRKEVFSPLNITSGGFGPPKDGKGKYEQPRGHRKSFFSFMGPKAVDTKTDNSPIIGPAGIVHMNLKDLVAFGNVHISGRKGLNQFLSKKSFLKLQSPILDDYGLGWVVDTKRDWAEGTVIWHNGSNTMWYALLVLQPESDLVIAVTSNDGNRKAASKAAWQLVKEITKMIQ